MKLCSACLLGINCRYDGKNSKNEKVLDLQKREVLIPVCPEQLGGLSTPRIPVEIRDRRVITQNGEDVTEFFEKGARETLKIAQSLHISGAILKERSPSCGIKSIFDGTFSHTVVKGSGITATLLERNGIKVISEEDL